MVPAAATAAAAPPARGTPLSDLVPASVVALLVVALVIAVAVAHRRRRLAALDRLSQQSERWTGLPGWAAVPLGVTTASLLIAVFGFYWDVSWHIDRGRDPGPFANPAHYFIIAGLAGIALAGILSVVIGVDEPTSTSVELRPDWHAPVGGLLLSICGVIALAGFPLDDMWHRIFGQDVTLWGPTHIQMIGGASLATLAMWVLLEEGRRATPSTDHKTPLGRLATSDVLLGGAFLIGLSTLQGEFDYGVPQFRQLYHPVLIVLAAAIGLTAVRIRTGRRGTALAATLFFLALRSGLTLLIGPILGRSTLHFPLYLAEAVIVEAVALVVPTRRQLTFGLWAGLGIGTVGLAAEWLWSHMWMPLPWHASLLPEGVILPVVAGVAGGVLGGLIGRALTPDPAERQPIPKGAGVGAGVAAVLCVALPLPMTAPSGLTADITLEPGPTKTTVVPVVRLNQTDAANDANWFDVTTWQGRRHGNGGLVIAPLHRTTATDGTGRAVFTTDRPIPVNGSWKALIRLHKGRQLAVVPVFLPADPAIPADGFGPDQHYQGAFVADKKILQREAIGGSVGLERAAYAILLALGAVWIGSLAWGLRRMAHQSRAETRPATTPPAAVRA